MATNHASTGKRKNDLYARRMENLAGVIGVWAGEIQKGEVKNGD